jgi:hypothetical protein
MSRLLLFLLLALIWSRPAGALIESDKFGWTEYRNDRFGLVMRYPSAVFTAHRSSASGDGDLYETPDGKARLLVGAFANSDHFTPGSYQAFVAKQSYPGLRADYAPIRGTWTDQYVCDDVSGCGVAFFTTGSSRSSNIHSGPKDEGALKMPRVSEFEWSLRASLDGSSG